VPFGMQEDIHDVFAQLVAERMKALRVGDGSHSLTQMGPCVNRDRVDWAHKHVDDAVRLGASILCGGSGAPAGLDKALAKGFFYAPTLLAGATPDMRVFAEETFAPVISLFKCACNHPAAMLYTSHEFIPIDHWSGGTVCWG
jgi:succinate-semialdehyde dehydrogenase / glutarate-semialdehyde dehydrogenase